MLKVMARALAGRHCDPVTLASLVKMRPSTMSVSSAKLYSLAALVADRLRL